MTKRELINSLERFPDDARVTVLNSESRIWSNVCFLTWKNSSERIMLNFKEGE